MKNSRIPVGKDPSTGKRPQAFSQTKNKKAWKGRDSRTIFHRDGSYETASVATKSVPNKLTTGMGKPTGGASLSRKRLGEWGAVEAAERNQARVDSKKPKGPKTRPNNRKKK